MELIANFLVDGKKNSITFNNVSGVNEVLPIAKEIVQSRFANARLSSIARGSNKMIIWINNEPIITKEKSEEEKNKEEEYRNYLSNLFAATIR